MGKASRKKAEARIQAPNEGLISCSFVFDGKVYEKKHQMNAFELRHMKELLRTHGDEACQQLVWKGAIKVAAYSAESNLAKAALDYIKSRHVTIKKDEVRDAVVAGDISCLSKEQQEAIKYVLAAKTTSERMKRKAEMHHVIYGNLVPKRIQGDSNEHPTPEA